MKKILLVLLTIIRLSLLNSVSASELLQNFQDTVNVGKAIINPRKAIFDENFDKLNKKYKSLLELFTNSEAMEKITTEEDAANVKEQIEIISKRFSINKNNIKQNKDDYDSLEQWSDEYKGLADDIYKEYSKAYDSYYADVISLPSGRIAAVKWGNNFNDFIQANKQNLSGLQLLDLINTEKIQIDDLAKQIYDYSYEQEKIKTEKYYKQMGKKSLCGNIDDIINQCDTPKTLCIYYIHRPLQVISVINGGVLAYDSVYQTNIFMQTNNKYVTNQIIDDLYLVYIGIFNYTTVLGAQQAVYKFQAMSKIEAENNFKTPWKNYFY